MTTRQRVKARSLRPLLVGVIASLADLRTARRLRNPPDLFEIRLDYLHRDLNELENSLSVLAARSPLIITARHPSEGGATKLSNSQRRELLLRFLPLASYIDVELRSVRPFAPILSQARQRRIRCIISVHDFQSTPTVRNLGNKAHKAKKRGADIFKIATRTDSKDQLARLLEFFERHKIDLAISAMGIGKLGRRSRRALLRMGSALNYAGLRSFRISGQPSLAEIRRWPKCSAGRSPKLG